MSNNGIHVDKKRRALLPVDREEQLDRIEAMLTRLLDAATVNKYKYAEYGETEDTDYYSHRAG